MTIQNTRILLGQISSMNGGDRFKVVVKRGDKEVIAEQESKDQHNFEEINQIT